MRALELPELERGRIAESARRVARSELHPQTAINELLAAYNTALRHTAPVPVRRADAGLGSKPQPGRERNGSEPTSYRLLAHSLLYEIELDRDGWRGIAVRVSTAPAVHGGFDLNVLSREGQLLRTATADLRGVKSDGWVSVLFPQIVNASKRVFRLRFDALESASEASVRLAESSSPSAPRRVTGTGRCLRGQPGLCCHTIHVASPRSERN
jgi:hypothetical protein